ncbi:hypothetical protein ACLUUI_20310 [Enterobacterales bacterium AW_CKDN230030176-1A_HGKHYDSX7]
MKRDLSKVLMPDHPLYTEAVKALKAYHQAEAEGIVRMDLKRLRFIAEHRFQTVIDYQLHVLGGPAQKAH